MIGWVVMRKSAALATIAFLASFTLPSLLFLYALPFAEHIGRLIKNKDRFSAHNLASTTYLATLPPLYWLAKSVWLEPHGIYQNYNQNISLQNAFSAIQITLTDIKYIAMNLEMGWYAGAIACIVALLPLSKQIIRWALSDQNSKPTWVLPLELAGTAALLLGIAPYLIAGHAPRWAVWDSRNQILIPFAFAILVTAVLTQLPKRISAATLATILGASIVYWSGQGYLLWRDWQKQIMIQRHWASDAKVAKADIVILDDQSSIGFANRRLPRFYELSGMLADAFGDEKRIGVEASQWIDAICNPNKNPMFRSKYYRTGDAKSSEGWDEHSWLIVRTTLSDKTPKPSKIHSLRYPTTNWLIASEPDQSMCIRSNPPHR